MWCLFLLFPAVKLAQVIRWSKPVYCNDLVLMTVFVHGQWLNISFISLRLSLTPTGQHNLLTKHLLSQSPFLDFFPLISFICTFLLSFTHSVFALCLTAPITHLSQFLSFHLMGAKGRQNDAVIKHSLCNSHSLVGCLLCRSLPMA